MMKTPAEILRIFEQRMAEMGMTQAQLEAKAFGKLGNSAIQGLKKGAAPLYERVEAMANALGLELYLGPPRISGLSEDGGKTDFRNGNLGRAGYLTIPWYEPGPGKGSAPIAFQANWLDRHGLNPERLSAVQPEIALVDGFDPARTVAIIEAHAPRHGVGQIWCLKEAGKIVIARIAWLPDGFVIMPPVFNEAPRVIRFDDAGAPNPIGRVACFAVVVPG